VYNAKDTDVDGQRALLLKINATLNPESATEATLNSIRHPVAACDRFVQFANNDQCRLAVSLNEGKVSKASKAQGSARNENKLSAAR